MTRMADSLEGDGVVEAAGNYGRFRETVRDEVRAELLPRWPGVFDPVKVSRVVPLHCDRSDVKMRMLLGPPWTALQFFINCGTFLSGHALVVIMWKTMQGNSSVPDQGGERGVHGDDLGALASSESSDKQRLAPPGPRIGC